MYSTSLVLAVCRCWRTGWRVDDYLCVFKLHLYHPPGSDPLSVPQIGTPSIVNAKPLAGSLMRAITSVKWSSTSRYVLTGFGVRSDGRVQDHSHPYVTRPSLPPCYDLCPVLIVDAHHLCLSLVMHV